MTKSFSFFAYATKDQHRIREILKRLGKESRTERVLESLAILATSYLQRHEWEKSLPDKKFLDAKNLADIKALERARSILLSECESSPGPRTEREIMTLLEKLDRKEAGGIQFANEIGVRALDYLIEDREEGSPMARMFKSGRAKTHRLDLIRNIATIWARINRQNLSECTISAADGSPMLEFIKVCLEPLTNITGEHIENEKIKIDVNKLKREIKRRMIPHAG